MTTYIPTVGPLKAYRLALVCQDGGLDPQSAVYVVAKELGGGVINNYLTDLARTAVTLAYNAVTLQA